MASYGDNKPVFRSRAAAAGLSDDFVQLLVDSHLDSLSKYAFCSSYVPGSGDDASFIRAIRNAIGRDPLIGEQASCRKLLHEAYALVTAEIKQQLERSEEVQARKLTQPERSDLYQKQVKKLVGLSLKGPMEPSDALVDVFCGMYDANRLRFVPWEKYTSKECELEKSAVLSISLQWKVQGNSVLSQKSQSPRPILRQRSYCNMPCSVVASAWNKQTYLTMSFTKRGLTNSFEPGCRRRPTVTLECPLNNCLKPTRSCSRSFVMRHEQAFRPRQRDGHWTLFSHSVAISQKFFIFCSLYRLDPSRRHHQRMTSLCGIAFSPIPSQKAKGKTRAKARDFECQFSWLRVVAGLPPTKVTQFVTVTIWEHAH